MPDEPVLPEAGSNPSLEPRLRIGTGLAGETTRSAARESATAPGEEETVLMGTDATARTEIIGDYEVLGKLGQGGMGAVYRARQISLDRRVALKILPTTLEADAEFVSRFQREARVAASLNHANLVKVYASGQANGCHYIAMELVEGETLSQWLKRGALPPPEALRICGDVARALDHGWQRAQLIHRDIKPGNIFLSVDGDVKVGDLGLAKTMGGDTTGLTQTGTAMGTPHYISPEQARGDSDLDFRADIYSLGCTLYQMLTGRTPYTGSDPMAVMSLHRDAPPPAILKVLPSCPIPLARLVGKMLKKAKRERHTSYAELIAEIERAEALFAPAASALEATLPPDPNATLLATPGHTPRSATPVTAPLPASAPKSKAALYGGLAAVVVILGVIAFIAWPKKEKLTKAQLYAQQHAAAPQAPSATPRSQPPLVPSAISAGARPSESTPPAIKLWSTAEAAPLGPGVKWEDGALRIDGAVSGFSAPTKRTQPFLRDVILRATVRLNPSALTVQLSIRCRGSLADGLNNYRLEIFPKENSIKLAALVNGQRTLLKEWPLPRAAGDEVWLPVEIRVAGEELTVSGDGHFLGSVRDSSVPDAGALQLYAKANGYFRDIEYIPLDGIASASAPPAAEPFLNLDGLPEAEALKLVSLGAPSSAPAEPWQDVLRDPRLILSGGAEREPEGLRFTGVSSARLRSPHRDAAIRMRTSFGGPRAYLRIRDDDRLGFYQLAAAVDKPAIYLSLWDGSVRQSSVLREFPLASPLSPGQDYELELRAAGQNLTARLNGETLGTITDAKLTEGRASAGGDSKAPTPMLIKALAFLDLDAPATTNGAATPAAATKEAPLVNSLGMKFVPVPITGGPTDRQRVLFSIWETRVQDYKVFAQETKRGWPKAPYEQGPTHPAVYVRWPDATDFCVWLTERERRSGAIEKTQVYRLPKDHEWSCAAGLGEREDESKSPGEKNGQIPNVYPWGTAWPPPPGSTNIRGREVSDANVAAVSSVLSKYRDEFVNTAPAGSFQPNALGIHDLGGNVWEWCEDLAAPPEAARVSRGGSFSNGTGADLFSSNRTGRDPALQSYGVGFRVVLAPAP